MTEPAKTPKISAASLRLVEELIRQSTGAGVAGEIGTLKECSRAHIAVRETREALIRRIVKLEQAAKK